MPSAPFLKHWKSGHIMCYKIGHIYLLLTAAIILLTCKYVPLILPHYKKKFLIKKYQNRKSP